MVKWSFLKNTEPVVLAYKILSYDTILYNVVEWNCEMLFPAMLVPANLAVCINVMTIIKGTIQTWWNFFACNNHIYTFSFCKRCLPFNCSGQLVIIAFFYLKNSRHTYGNAHVNCEFERTKLRPDLKICWFAITRVCFSEYI